MRNSVDSQFFYILFFFLHLIPNLSAYLYYEINENIETNITLINRDEPMVDRSMKFIWWTVFDEIQRSFDSNCRLIELCTTEIGQNPTDDGGSQRLNLERTKISIERNESSRELPDKTPCCSRTKPKFVENVDRCAHDAKQTPLIDVINWTSAMTLCRQDDVKVNSFFWSFEHPTERIRCPPDEHGDATELFSATVW